MPAADTIICREIPLTRTFRVVASTIRDHHCYIFRSK